MLFLTLAAWTTGLAEDSDRLRRKLNLAWTHYDPLGYAVLSFSTDYTMQDIQQVGVGHWFDWPDMGLHVKASKGSYNEWSLAYDVSKIFFENYRLSLFYHPALEEIKLGFQGHIEDVFFRVSYGEKKLTLGGSWKASDRLLFHGNLEVYEHHWSAFTGLNIAFCTGTKKRKEVRRIERKPIRWLNGPADKREGGNR